MNRSALDRPASPGRSVAPQQLVQCFFDDHLLVGAVVVNHLDDAFFHDPPETKLVEKDDFFFAHGSEPPKLSSSGSFVISSGKPAYS
jgi:hypothetical protein